VYACTFGIGHAILSLSRLWLNHNLYMMNTTTSAHAAAKPAQPGLLTFFRVDPSGRIDRLFPDQRITQEGRNLKSNIDAFLWREKPFLRHDYTLPRMVRDTGIPRHVLSLVINREYGMNFTTLLHSLRVRYLMAIPTQDPDWRMLTLEALGRRAGFLSRNTLTKAFKKCTGEYPSAFFARAMAQQRQASDPAGTGRVRPS
jgi:AraC-like DNA-binding protein